MAVEMASGTGLEGYDPGPTGWVKVVRITLIPLGQGGEKTPS
jgi:hypothetical protein